MAITVEWGFESDTSLARSMTIQNLKFSEQFSKRVLPKSVGNEAILQNNTSPLGRVELVRIAQQTIADMYKGTGISPAYMSANRRGTSVLLQVMESLLVTDSDLQSQYILPASAHLVLKVPESSIMTSSRIYTLLTRLLGLLYEDNDTHTDSRVSALLRGAVLPKGVG